MLMLKYTVCMDTISVTSLMSHRLDLEGAEAKHTVIERTRVENRWDFEVIRRESGSQFQVMG
jgi:hypothetical protein